MPSRQFVAHSNFNVTQIVNIFLFQWVPFNLTILYLLLLLLLLLFVSFRFFIIYFTFYFVDCFTKQREEREANRNECHRPGKTRDCWCWWGWRWCWWWCSCRFWVQENGKKISRGYWKLSSCFLSFFFSGWAQTPFLCDVSIQLCSVEFGLFRGQLFLMLLGF